MLFGKPPFPAFGPGVYREALAPPADAAAVGALVAALREAEKDLATWSEDHHKGCVCATCAETLPQVRAALALAVPTEHR